MKRKLSTSEMVVPKRIAKEIKALAKESGFSPDQVLDDLCLQLIQVRAMYADLIQCRKQLAIRKNQPLPTDNDEPAPGGIEEDGPHNGEVVHGQSEEGFGLVSRDVPIVVDGAELPIGGSGPGPGVPFVGPGLSEENFAAAPAREGDIGDSLLEAEVQ